MGWEVTYPVCIAVVILYFVNMLHAYPATSSDVELRYQHYEERICKRQQAKLDYEIESDQHICRLAEKMTA